MVVQRQLARVGIQREGAQGAGQPRHFQKQLFGMAALGSNRCRRGARAELTACSSQKLAISRVENSRPAALPAPRADGGALFVEDFDQALHQHHQPRAGADLQHRRHEIGVVGEVAGTIAHHARDGHSEQVAGRLGIDQQSQILAAQAHAALVGAGVLVVQHAGFRQVARIGPGLGLQRAVETVRLARGNGQQHRDAVARGRKQIGDGARLGQRVAFRHVERSGRRGKCRARGAAKPFRCGAPPRPIPHPANP